MHIFVHIPSTAGTTLWSVLKEATGNKVRRFKGGVVQENAVAAREFLSNPPDGLAIVGGHLPYGCLESVLPGTPHFTFLREPVERLKSVYFRHVRNGKRPLGEDPAAGLLETARDQRSTVIMLLTGIDKHVVEQRYDEPGFAEEIIDRVGDSYTTIGLAERFDESLAMLGRDMGWPSIPSWERRNRGGNKHAFDVATIERVRELLRVEFTLYDTAVKIHNSRRPSPGSADWVRLKCRYIGAGLRQRVSTFLNPAFRDRYLKR
jgi:hypothetical protein